MAKKLQRTPTPNLDYNPAYKKNFGRVKVNGNVVREYLGTNKQAAESELIA